MFRDVVNQAELETETGHKQLGLVTGLALEGHRVVAGQLRSKALTDQSDLGRTDAVDRLRDENNKNDCAKDHRPVQQGRERQQTVEHTSSGGQNWTSSLSIVSGKN